jgi:polysaccharide biosynthesis/export protein
MKHGFSSSSYKPLILISLVIMFLASCVPQKKIKYMQKLQEEDTTSVYLNKRTEDYKIQPKDNLYIKIVGMDEKGATFFSKQGTATYNDNTTDASIYLNSYSVSPEGDVDFPILGKVIVKDLTLSEVKTLLQKLVDEYMKETIIIVKMVNFNVTILGEVYRPGEYKIYQDRVNLFEAVSMAGDMTDYANRNQIALIRQTKEGSKVHYLDMTRDNILTSKYFYLMPNDIIYISPLPIKRWGFSQFPYALVLTGITAVTSMLLLIYTIK